MINETELAWPRPTPGVPVTRGKKYDLPPPFPRFLHRQREVEALRSYLQSDKTRLITVTGLGGVGKTQLAIEAARLEASAFDDAIAFIDLTDVTDPAQVTSALVSAIGVPCAPVDSLFETLALSLQHRRMLLILDGFEHIVSATTILNRLVACCPSVKLLVTSREPLRLSVEHVLLVEPLPVPNLEELPEVSDLARIAAVDLFVQRAQDIHFGFALTEENARDVAELTVRLDGIPLAIELAATRTNLLPPSAILKNLDARYELLRANAPDVEPRHRSLPESLKRNQELLSEPPRALFRQLAVFEDGFSLDGAKNTALTRGDSFEILDTLSTLVDCGLVHAVVTDESESRYSVVEVMHAYALEELSASGEEDQVRERHARYFVEFAERAAGEIQRPNEQLWIPSFELEQANLYAALIWTREQNQIELELRLISALAKFWRATGALQEGRRQLEETLARDVTVSAPLKAQGLNALGNVLDARDDLGQAVLMHRAALKLTTVDTDSALRARIMLDLATALAHDHALEEAEGMLNSGVALWREIGNSFEVARALLAQGSVQMERGLHARALASCKESVSIFQDLADSDSAAVSLTVRFNVAEDTDLPSISVNDTAGIRQEWDEPAAIAAYFEGLAELSTREGRPDEAAWLWEEADALSRISGQTQSVREQQSYAAALGAVRTAALEQKLDIARVQGRKLWVGESMREALLVVHEVTRSQLSRKKRGNAGGRGVLSAREQEVLRLVARGYSNRQAAEELCISENTVKFHVTSLLNKLGADSRAQVVALASRRKLLT